eukprot:8207233-Pyramimonas_sp.AAC.2
MVEKLGWGGWWVVNYTHQLSMQLRMSHMNLVVSTANRADGAVTTDGFVSTLVLLIILQIQTSSSWKEKSGGSRVPRPEAELPASSPTSRGGRISQEEAGDPHAGGRCKYVAKQKTRPNIVHPPG